jgi:hypothetical protein
MRQGRWRQQGLLHLGQRRLLGLQDGAEAQRTRRQLLQPLGPVGPDGFGR